MAKTRTYPPEPLDEVGRIADYQTVFPTRVRRRWWWPWRIR